MSYSSGSVAALWSPPNFNAAEMSVTSTRRYFSTSGTASYRDSERSYLSPSYTSATTRDYRSRLPPTGCRSRSSTSVPTSYARQIESHEGSGKYGRKEANENSLSSYPRSKTDSDVSSALERCGYKLDSYKYRTDAGTNRFLNTPMIDSKYSPSRKFIGGIFQDSTRLDSVKSSKITDSTSRLQRKDSLTRSEKTDTSPSPIRSLERKSSSSVTGGSSSPIEINKSSEVWNNRLSSSYESAMKGCFENDLSQMIDNENQAKLTSRENSEDLSESSIILEHTESEEKKLSFEEIRRLFDNNDSGDLKIGFESSLQKSSHSKDSKISNGVILGVRSQYSDRKLKKSADNSLDDTELDSEQYETNNSFPSSQPLHGQSLKRVPNNLKSYSNNSTNISSNHNNYAYSNLRKSPDPIPEVSNNVKKNGLEKDLEMVMLSPEKEANLPSLTRLTGLSFSESGQRIDEGTAKGDVKRDVRKSLFSNTLALDNRNDFKNQSKRKVEKLVAKPLELESETLGNLPKLRRSPETKPKDFENETRVIELRKIEPFLKSSFEISNKTKDTENKEKKVVSAQKLVEKSPQKTKLNEKQIKTSPVRDVAKVVTASKEPETNSSPGATRKEYSVVKPKKNTSLKDEKETKNVRARELNKRLSNEETVELKLPKKAEDKPDTEANLKEAPQLEKMEMPKNFNSRTLPGPSAYQSTKSCSPSEQWHGTYVMLLWVLHVAWFVLMLATVASFVLGTLAPFRTPTSHFDLRHICHGGGLFCTRTLVYGRLSDPNQDEIVCTDGKRLKTIWNDKENAGIHGTSPRLNAGYNRNSSIEKGGLNGLRNIGNTCFMNSVIQCLSNTKPLLEYLLNEDYLSDINTTISGMKGALIKAFSNVIQELWAPNAEDKIINTINFKSQIQRFAPRFMGYSQQDAQEFLRYLLEGLHEDVNRVTAKPKPITTDIDDTLSDNQKAAEAWKRYLRMDDSKVVDIFVGQLKSTLQCTVCGHCSVTFDPFWDLSLPVPNRNGQLRLSSCLDAFTKEEVLDGDEKPTCSKCKTRRKCTKSFSIQKFPKILVLHLKRFSPTERYRGKLSVTVEFPLTNLDLSPYASNRGQSCTYNLYAISNHSGTAYSGHYTAYCKHPYTGNWHEYNDSGVSSLSSRSVVSGEAYVLFYELAA